MNRITCFNRDKQGICLAFNKGECSEDCSARIADVDSKIDLLRCLLSKAQAKKDRRKLEEELEAAQLVKEAIKAKKLEGWMSCYLEDLHRGEKGGASESDSNRKTSMKQLMKDNRPVGVKPTRAQQEEYKEALHEFEEQVGEKMEKLGRTSLSHSKVNSYTGEPICYTDPGEGDRCMGQRTAAGKLARDCKDCPWLKDGVV